jgi:uncharacterized protein YraI
LAGAALAGLLLGVAPLAVSHQAWANQVIQATTTVNIRSGPSTDHSIIGLVYWGHTIEATGPSSDGWTPVNLNGRTGYVASQYFTGGSTTTTTTTTTTTGAAGTATTTAALNVRSGPSTGHSRLTTLAYGSTVQLTGTITDGFAQIVFQSGTAWVATDWLSATSPAAPAPAAPAAPAPAETPAVSGQMQTAADLNFRSGPGLDQAIIHVIPRGTTVDITAVSQNGFRQIVRQNRTGWVSQQYLVAIAAADPPAPAAPAASGQLYTTDYLNLRSLPSPQGAVVTVLPKGTAVTITGAKNGIWQEIIYQGSIRWASSDYLATTPPVVVAPPALTTTPAQAKELARGQVAAKGWGDDQFQCLVSLWERESSWRMNAENPSSGAYGIPQALPAEKMASAGSDWRTSAATQISWGLGYIAGSYKTPCGAWQFFQGHGWY